MEIREVHAREVIDSRGDPTIEVEVSLADGSRGWAAIPSGASTGRYEALELRDGDAQRYHGRGVLRAVENVRRVIAAEIDGMDPGDQETLDRRLKELDGSENKSGLGANAILGVSLAAARAAAESAGMPLYQHLGRLARESAPTLPMPLMNVLNGGAHADNSLDIQEFMVVPVGAGTFRQAVRMGCEVFQTLKRILMERRLSTSVGDEGGFSSQLDSSRDALGILLEAIERSGYRPGEQVALALDVAASELLEQGAYRLEGHSYSADELVGRFERWLTDCPLISIEDGLDQEDWEGWRGLTERLGNRVQLVGDDLFATNPVRLQRGVEEGIANAVLVKPNQIGTLSETLEAIRMAKEAGYRAIISHRSGETEDPFIADLALGASSGQIKTGSVSRGERTAKYNRLIRLEDRHGLELAPWPAG